MGYFGSVGIPQASLNMSISAFIMPSVARAGPASTLAINAPTRSIKTPIAKRQHKSECNKYLLHLSLQSISLRLKQTTYGTVEGVEDEITKTTSDNNHYWA